MGPFALLFDIFACEDEKGIKKEYQLNFSEILGKVELEDMEGEVVYLYYYSCCTTLLYQIPGGVKYFGPSY